MRRVLSACGDVKEMLLNGKYTQLAGNLIMSEYMDGVMESVAKNRWINAKNVDARTLVTASLAEYLTLLKTKPENMKLKRLEEVVLECL